MVHTCGGFMFTCQKLHSGGFADTSLSYTESQYDARPHSWGGNSQYDEFGQQITRQQRGGFERARGRGRGGGRGRGRSRRAATKCFIPPIDPRPGDWLCTQCKCINHRPRSHCINCGIFVLDEFPRWSNEDGSPWIPPPPFEPFPGDWRCGACRKWNFKDTIDCHSCGNQVNDQCESVPLPALRHGQFYCPQCTTLNHAYRKSCIKCETDRPYFAGPPQGTNRGKWRCPDCKCINVGLCEKCRSCGRSLDANCAVDKGCDRLVQPGDWQCSQCLYCNMVESGACLRCQEARSPTARNIAGIEAFSALPGDWVCSKCSVANTRFDSTCFLCGTDRQPEAFEFQYDANPTKMKAQAIPFDWECSKCHRYIFAFHETCPTCPGSSRKLNHCLPAKEWCDAKLGDWRCESCGVTTKQDRNRCFRCGTHRSNHSDSITITVLNGKIMCGKCNRPNTTYRSDCIHCGTVRGFGTVAKLSNQWVCVHCDALNLSWMSNCFFCHEKRPVNES